MGLIQSGKLKPITSKRPPSSPGLCGKLNTPTPSPPFVFLPRPAGCRAIRILRRTFQKKKSSVGGGRAPPPPLAPSPSEPDGHGMTRSVAHTSLVLMVDGSDNANVTATSCSLLLHVPLEFGSLHFKADGFGNGELLVRGGNAEAASAAAGGEGRRAGLFAEAWIGV